MTEQSERQICPHCGHKNEIGASTCAQCGESLEEHTTTVRVPVPPPDQARTISSRAVHPSALLADSVAVFIGGEIQPIIVKDSDTIILGRRASGESPPIVDLTEYNAHALGVSRRHAMIRRVEDGHTIEDLGSVNGTWLNENRLPANEPRVLRNGDLVRLGQLMLFVYFYSQNPDKAIG